MPRIGSLIVSIAITLQTAAPTWATGCMPYDAREYAMHYYRMALETSKDYVVVVGRLDLESTEPRRRVKDEYSEWRGRLVGQALGGEGFSIPYDRNIRIRGVCTDPLWCYEGTTPPSNLLAFVEMTETGPILTTGPCRMWVVPDPPLSAIRQLERCHMTGACSD